MTTIATLTVLSPKDIRNAYLRTIRQELIARGVINPNVLPGSDYAVRAEALSQQIAPAMANAVVAADANMPDRAVGDRLIRWMTIVGLSFRPAQGSNGNIVYSTAASGYVPVNAQLVDDQGQFYQVATGATYADGDPIPIASISTGKSTNRIAGTILQWVSPPPYANSKQLVATGGLIDGADADTEEIARQRLLNRLKNAAGGGNWQQTVEWAYAASSSVVGAFDYPALYGPSTYGIWVLGAMTYDAVNGFSRQLSNARRATISAYIAAAKPPESQIVLPTIAGPPFNEDEAASVSIMLELPPSVAAGGPGGGWIDPVPWPGLLGAATYCAVSTVTTPTQITIDGSTTDAPDPAGIVDGSTQIAWFDPVSWWNSGGPTRGTAVKTSTIVSHSGSTGSVTIVLDPANPFTGVSGVFIWPTCEQAEDYVQAWLAAVEAMGPGEWTGISSMLPRSLRHPLPSQSAPSALGGAQLRAVQDVGAEVLDIAYAYRSQVSPTLPATSGEGPHVLVPGIGLGFYPLV
jgi:uncharacterized phage protein gp47/JayE